MKLIQDKYKRIIDYLRISVTDRCNLRCIYCMPPGGVRFFEHGDILRYEEIARVVRIAARFGVNKVRITGGEPLARKNLPFLIESLSKINGIEDISLTTNGVLLKKYARLLAAAGLNRVNVSLDSLNPRRYHEITRGGKMLDVLDGMIEAERAGLQPVKINMIPIRGVNDDEIEEFARLTFYSKLQVRFIEFMPTGMNEFWREDRCVPADEIKKRVSRLGPLVPIKLRKSGPARYFRFERSPGVVGFISPVTHHFCESCNRLRLTADGKLRPCLFSEATVDLKRALRSEASDAEIEKLLLHAVGTKPEKSALHSGRRFYFAVPMSKIGG